MAHKSADQQQFRQMWDDAQIRFKEKTKMTLRPNDLSLDDVLRLLDKRLNADDPVENDKQDRIKRLTSNMLKIIEIFGGVAAQGASIMFSPAGLCFNALEFLIKIPARISEFYDDVANLFEEISAFSKNFKVYQRIEDFADLGDELRESSHKLMIVFVDICAMSIDILSSSKTRTFKHLAKKALLDDDSGVRDKREEFRQLVEHQGQLSGAITLEHVLKSEYERKGDTNKLFEALKSASENGRQQLAKLDELNDGMKTVISATSGKEKQRERNERICKKLSVPHTTSQASNKAFQQIVEKIEPNTGDWLEQCGAYKDWLDFDSKAGQVLFIGGPNGCGKSYLAHAIMDKVKTGNHTGKATSTRVSYALYRFEKDERRPRDNAIREAFRSIAAQVAQQDEIYSTRLLSHLESKDTSIWRDMAAKDLLGELVPPPNLRERRDVAYVLLFDDLDKLTDEEAGLLFQAVRAPQSTIVRILMTGNQDTLDRYLYSTDKTLDPLPNIQVTDWNNNDIQRFIESELRDCKDLEGNAPHICRIQDAVREKLPEITGGNFNHVKLIIRIVGEKVSEEYEESEIIDAISGETIGMRKAATEKSINELTHSFTTSELDQLNELLAWTIWAYESTSVDQMKAALLLRIGRPPNQELKHKIEKKFYRLLQVKKDNTVRMRNDELQEFFVLSQRPKLLDDTEGIHDPRISLSITVEKMKLSQVQRFFWDFTEKVQHDNKFMIEPQPIDQEQGPSAAAIRASFTDGHLALTKRCFDILLGEPKEETDALAPYALKNLPYHLSALVWEVETQALLSTECEEIASDLVSLLQNANCISDHLVEDFFIDKWWLDEGVLEAIPFWLEKSGMGKNGRRKPTWMRQVSRLNGPAALKTIAAMIAHHWLCERKWSAELPFQWIDAFLDLESREIPAGRRGSSTSDDGQQDVPVHPAEELMSPKDRVERAAEWAKNELKITKSSLWYERIGQTYLWQEGAELGHAIEALLTAKEHPDWSWSVSESLAKAYAFNEQKPAAVEEMERALTFLRANDQENSERRDALVKNLTVIAKWQFELENVEDSIDKVREAIQLGDETYDSHFQLLDILVDTDRESEATKLLNNMESQAGSDDLNQLGSMILAKAAHDSNDMQDGALFRAAKYPSTYLIILRALQQAYSHVQETNRTKNQMKILTCQGSILDRYGDEAKSRDGALEKWKACCELLLQSEEEEEEEDLVIGDLGLEAILGILAYHFAKIRIAQRTGVDFSYHVQELKELPETFRGYSEDQDLIPPLAYFHSSVLDDKSAAQKLLLGGMEDGFELLSDSDPENDYLGFCRIASALMHFGDDLNALSAWSLWGPCERYTGRPEQGDYCSGCEKKYSFADSVWFCKVCNISSFDDECFEKLKNGTLGPRVCDKEHDWLRIPSWEDEFKETGKGKVRIGGEYRDDKRIGGEIVEVVKWLETIREQWGIKKPMPIEEPKVDEKAEIPA